MCGTENKFKAIFRAIFLWNKFLAILKFNFYVLLDNYIFYRIDNVYYWYYSKISIDRHRGIHFILHTTSESYIREQDSERVDTFLSEI